ncbi:S9 family peptidase [Dyadobacter sp. CY312]|uniref:alpha/beta hydrolase family protein n=1 Tax=Dyadobacter sp. CY312 TaxID=2907303 RepID=UPI001F43CE68|nr:lipase family protein [Dyadobacter sp. CY312]MCE7041940.1 lipase family protein [Dyadobacter sp. CY312]
MAKFIFTPLLRNTWLVFILTILILSGCDNENKPVDPVQENKYLKESSLIKELSKDDILKINPLFAAYVKNGIKVYKVTYKTTNTDGAEITASGAVIMPVSNQPASMISVQHGTITTDAEAPSHYASSSETATFGAMFGAMGYIIAYPDYIGYGASKDLPHPYEHRASLGSASLDLLRASKELLKGQTAVKWDEKLFLAGYSEGGYATMSLQKRIEEEASTEFNLRASSCGAGAYDKTAFMKEIINNQTHAVVNYNRLYLWVLLSYDRIYKLNKPATYYFKEPWAAQIAAANGDPSKVLINTSFHNILTDSFKKALNDGTDQDFIKAIADNDVYNWKPKTPTKLYHGLSDQLVFPFNSVNAEAAMKKLGAADVQFIPVPGGDHGSTITPYLLGTLTFFQDPKYK